MNRLNPLPSMLAGWKRRSSRLLGTTTAYTLSKSLRLSICNFVFLLGLSVLAPGTASAQSSGGGSWIDTFAEAVVDGLKTVLRWFFTSIGDPPGDNVFAKMLVYLFGTPLPPQAKQWVPQSYQRTQSSFSPGFWDPFIELNTFFVELSTAVLAIYIALLLGGLSLNFIQPSKFYQGTIKASLALVLLNINLELLGLLFGVVRMLTVFILPTPETVIKSFFGFLTGILGTAPAIMYTAALAILTVVLLLLLCLVLAVRIVIIFILVPVFPVMITSYTLASDFSGAKKVFEPIFGYTFPSVVVIIPVALVFRFAAEMFAAIATPSGLSLVNMWFYTFLGLASLTLGLFLAIKTTTVGRTAISATMKLGGLAAFGGAAVALGGTSGLASGAMMKQRFGTSAGLMSATQQGVRQTKEAESETPPIGGELFTKMPGIEEDSEGTDLGPVVNGTDYSEPAMQFTNENPRARNNLEWDFADRTAQISQEDDVVRYTGANTVSSHSWGDFPDDTGQTVAIRQHPKHPDRTVIQPRTADKETVGESMGLSGISGTWHDDWEGFVTEDTIEETQLRGFSNNIFGRESGVEDQVIIDRNTITQGNVKGSNPPIRSDAIEK
jgi:hypothetical protein